MVSVNASSQVWLAAHRSTCKPKTKSPINMDEGDVVMDVGDVRLLLERSILEYCCTWLTASISVQGHLAVTLDSKQIIWIQLTASTTQTPTNCGQEILQPMTNSDCTELEIFKLGVISFIQDLCNKNIHYCNCITIEGLLGITQDQHDMLIINFRESENHIKTEEKQQKNPTEEPGTEVYDSLIPNIPKKALSGRTKQKKTPVNKRKSAPEQTVRRTQRAKKSRKLSEDFVYEEIKKKSDKIREDVEEQDPKDLAKIPLEMLAEDAVDGEDEIQQKSGDGQIEHEEKGKEDKGMEDRKKENRRKDKQRKGEQVDADNKQVLRRKNTRQNAKGVNRWSSDSQENSVRKPVIEESALDVAESQINVTNNQCAVCLKMYSTRYYLKTHMLVHEKSSGFSCSQCGKSYVNIHHLRRHQLSHNDKKPHECLICAKGYVDERGLAIHMKSHTGEQRDYHTCPEPECDKKYLRKDALVHHIRSHIGGMPYTCPYCPEKFLTRADLGTHRRSQHKNIKNYLCPICATAFITKAKLDDHMAKHSEERPFTCPICDTTTKTKTYLRVHMKNVHMQKKLHLCPYCTKGFKCKSSLVNHVRVHEGKLPYSCLTCSKAFPSKERLLQHCKIHVSHNHQCSQCGQKFTDLLQVIQHLKSHVSRSELCSLCDQGFTTEYELKQHLKTEHTSGVCCNAMSWTEHMQKHKQISTFTCVYCHKIFSDNNKLDNHISHCVSSSKLTNQQQEAYDNVDNLEIKEEDRLSNKDNVIMEKMNDENRQITDDQQTDLQQIQIVHLFTEQNNNSN